MNMTPRSIAIITKCMSVSLVAVFLAVGSGATIAHADHGGNTGDYHSHGKCDGINRMPKSDASCLSGGWDNNFDTATMGYSHWVRNECAAYGTVIVHHDVIDASDRHWHLEDGNRKEYISLHQTRNLYCCFDDSELCFKSQVEAGADDASDGHIKQVTVGNGLVSGTYVDVSTHYKRYRFCQANPDDIYCTVDPSGDAKTEPPGPACAEDNSCNCGDHYCTEADCTSKWDETTPATRGLFEESGDPDYHGCAPSDDSDYGSYFSATIDADDGTSQSCTLQVVCGAQGGANTYENGAWTYTRNLKRVQLIADVGDIYSHYNCGGVLYESSCFSGTVASTHIEDIEITVDLD